MLSTRAFNNSTTAQSYYSHGDYYGGEANGIWFGKGAEAMGFTGKFQAKTDQRFNNLLQGILPNGQVLGRKTKEGIEHRPGIDLTFSVPKSFSIQMLVYAKTPEREKMETALMKAVSSTLGYIEEKGYAIARKGKSGIEKEPISKLTFACFLHTTNRNLEPQAHVHCFLANAAECSDGKFRSLEFKDILKNNKLFGQIFRNELAIETKKIGYEIIPTTLSDGSSAFELSHIDEKLIKGFSTRRQEIEALFELYDVKTKEGRDNIVINSRKAKQLVSEEELSNAWQKLEQKIQQEIQQEIQQNAQGEAQRTRTQAPQSDAPRQNKKQDTQPFFKVNLATATKIFKQEMSILLSKAANVLQGKEIQTKSKQGRKASFNTKANSVVDITTSTSNNSTSSTTPHESAATLTLADIAALCLEDVTHHNTLFIREDLLKKALKFSIGNYGVKEIESEINHLEKKGLLIRHGNLCTSKSLLLQEIQILKYAKKAIGVAKPILQDKHFKAHLEKYEKSQKSKDKQLPIKMNEQQKEVLRHILISKDKIITVEGLPGVGKSTVLDAVRFISGKKILNLSSSALRNDNGNDNNSDRDNDNLSNAVISNKFIDLIGNKLTDFINDKLLTNNSSIGLAPTASAAKTLKESANLIESSTIHSFLSKNIGYLEGRGDSSLQAQKQYFRDVIIFVDECSLIPTHLMAKLTKLQDLFGFRVIFVGDTKQLDPVEAGNPFTQILEIIPPAKMDIIVRQEQISHRQAVMAASIGDIKTTFEIHQDNIKEITKLPELAEESSKFYLQKSAKQREQTLLISPTRALRDEVNSSIITALRNEQILSGEIIEFKALRQKDMSIADYQFAPSYMAGNDILKFHKTYRNGIVKNEYLRIKKVNVITNSLILIKENNFENHKNTHRSNNGNNNKEEIIFQLRKGVDYRNKFEVFNEHKVDLQQGLKIIFTKNNYQAGLINSETAVIKAIQDINIKDHNETSEKANNNDHNNRDQSQIIKPELNKILVLQFENQTTKEIPLNQLKHIDYGYCVTVHTSQGKTFANTIAAIEAHPYLNNLKSWLVSLSRHRKELTIFLENQEAVKTYLAANIGREISAIELNRLQKAEKSALIKAMLQAKEVVMEPETEVSSVTASALEINKANSVSPSYSYKSYRANKISFNQQVSATEIHNKLCSNLPHLAEFLLPNVSSKKIIIKTKEIKCGSITIVNAGNKKGTWYRHSAGYGGNLFDLIQESQGLTDIKAAIEWSKDYLGVDKAYYKSPNNNKPADLANNQNEKTVKILLPTPKDASKFIPERTFYYLLKKGDDKIEAVHQYCNIKNELCGYVVRIKNSITNEKKTLPVVYAIDTKKNEKRWISKGFGEDRPLYNEQNLANNDKPVLIVEGEKTADSAQMLYPEFNVVSWCGGANGFKYSDWQVLRGKEVVIWPDNDQPGIAAAIGIKIILESEQIGAHSCKIIDLQKLPNLPAKWDLADSLPSKISRQEINDLLFKAANLIRSNSINKAIQHTNLTRNSELSYDKQPEKLKQTEQEELKSYSSSHIEVKEQIRDQKSSEPKITTSKQIQAEM